MFWSDLGPDVGYEAVGIVDSSLPTVAVFAKPSAKEENAESTDNSNKVSKLFAMQNMVCLIKTRYFLSFKKQESNPEKQQSTVKSEETSQIVKNIDHTNSEKKETCKDTKSAEEPKEDYSKGVIFYLQGDIVVGIVLWNLFNRIRIAKQVR